MKAKYTGQNENSDFPKTKYGQSPFQFYKVKYIRGKSKGDFSKDKIHAPKIQRQISADQNQNSILPSQNMYAQNPKAKPGKIKAKPSIEGEA